MVAAAICFAMSLAFGLALLQVESSFRRVMRLLVESAPREDTVAPGKGDRLSGGSGRMSTIITSRY